MAHLTLAGLSEDGKRLLLVDDHGQEFTLDADQALRRVLRGEHARLGQLEIHMDASLRPRDIQARIRAGETPEAVAQAAQTTVDKVMPFAAPVLAERAHVADRAQRASIRRASGEGGARVLGTAVAEHLHRLNVSEDVVEWDAWRREDGRWTLTGSFSTSERNGNATYVFDAPGNYVTVDNADARWLIGDPVTPRKASGGTSRSRRLTSVPQEDELPLGEDAIEMVHEQDQDETVEEPSGDGSGSSLAEDSPFLAGAFDRQNTGADPEPATADDQQPAAGDDQQPAAGDDQQPGTEDPSAEQPEPATEDEPAGDAPRPRRTRKNRGRASVPSWDEIMFGGKD